MKSGLIQLRVTARLRGGAVAAEEFVGAHRDSAPLLEPVEAALDDIAALVAFLLLVAEVDRPARLFAAVRDLVVPLRDRRRDASFAKPGSVRSGRVPLVGQDSVGAGAGPTLPGAGHADVLEHGGHHRGVVDVPAGDHHPQRSAAPVADHVQLGRQPAAGAADPVIRRLEPRILVIRQSPLCPARGSRRADAHARSWSRWTRPSRSSRRRLPASAPRPTASPRCRSRPNG